QQVEFMTELPHTFQHYNVQSVWIANRAIQPQSRWPRRLKPCRGIGISAREQRHVIAEGDQLFGQPVNNPFRAAIEFATSMLDPRRGYARFPTSFRKYFGTMCQMTH